MTEQKHSLLLPWCCLHHLNVKNLYQAWTKSIEILRCSTKSLGGAAILPMYMRIATCRTCCSSFQLDCFAGYLAALKALVDVRCSHLKTYTSLLLWCGLTLPKHEPLCWQSVCKDSLRQAFPTPSRPFDPALQMPTHSDWMDNHAY